MFLYFIKLERMWSILPKASRRQWWWHWKHFIFRFLFLHLFRTNGQCVCHWQHFISKFLFFLHLIYLQNFSKVWGDEVRGEILKIYVKLSFPLSPKQTNILYFVNIFFLTQKKKSKIILYYLVLLNN